jgi:hypothetical protein
MHQIKARGCAILVISHRLPEIMELADDITVLKDGVKVATVERSAVSAADVVRMMVGRELEDIFPPRPSATELAALNPRDPALESASGWPRRPGCCCWTIPPAGWTSARAATSTTTSGASPHRASGSSSTRPTPSSSWASAIASW